MDPRPVLIVGPVNEPHVAGMAARLRALGAPVAVIDVTRFPEELTLTLGERGDDILIDGRRIRPAAVYVRNLSTGPMSTADLPGGSAEDWWRTLVVDRERSA